MAGSSPRPPPPPPRGPSSPSLSDVPRRKRSLFVHRRPAAEFTNKKGCFFSTDHLTLSTKEIYQNYQSQEPVNQRSMNHIEDHWKFRNIGRARKCIFPIKPPFQEQEESSIHSVDPCRSYYHLIEGSFSSSSASAAHSSCSSAVVIVTNPSLSITERNKIDPNPLQDEVLNKVLESMNKDRNKIGVLVPTSQHLHHIKRRERKFVDTAYDYVDQFQMIMDRTWDITHRNYGLLPLSSRPSTSNLPPSPPLQDSDCECRPLLVRNNKLQSEDTSKKDDDDAVILVMLKDQLGRDEVPTRLIGARKEIMGVMDSIKKAVNVEYMVNKTVGRSVVIKNYVQAFHMLMKMSSQMKKDEKDKSRKTRST